MRAGVRWAAGRWVGDRPVPVGDVARDRRLLNHLRGRPLGRLLVVGPALAARQALPGFAFDVAGTSPHMSEVTVCSSASGPGSLPPAQWDTVVVSDPGLDFAARLAAAVPACRAGGRLLVVDRAVWPCDAPELRALAEAGPVSLVAGARKRRLWQAEVGP